MAAVIHFFAAVNIKKYQTSERYGSPFNGMRLFRPERSYFPIMTSGLYSTLSLTYYKALQNVAKKAPLIKYMEEFNKANVPVSVYVNSFYRVQ